jgi:hypothetical protein
MTISNVVFAIPVPVDGDEPARRFWDEPVVGEQGEGRDGDAQLEGLPVPHKIRHCIQAKQHLSMLLNSVIMFLFICTTALVDVQYNRLPKHCYF